MKKIAFFTILLSIIFYGFLSNYSKKKEFNSYLQKNLTSDLSSNEDKIYGCESIGIIPSTYCRLTKDECLGNIFKPFSEVFEIIPINRNNILHCSTYKIGVDSSGSDIIVDKFTYNKISNIKDEFKKSKLSQIKFFLPGEGICIEPKKRNIKYGIISNPLRKRICSIIEDDVEVNYFQKFNDGNYLNMIDLGLDDVFWFNKTGY